MRFLLVLVCGFALYGVSKPCRGEEVLSDYGKVYVERDSGPLKADTYLPAGKGPYPGVLVVHGGAWHMGSRAQLSGIARELAQRGFCAVAISYRLAPQDKFPAQIEDCKAAVRWMRSHAEQLKLDPLRIGGFGYSAGAHLVTLMGTTDSSDGLEGIADPEHQPSTRLQAVVAGGTPTDFCTIPESDRWLSFWLGGTRGQVSEQYRLASPAAFVTVDDPPMFLFHGENDELVPLVSSQWMVKQLQQSGITSQLYVVPQVGHIAAGMDRSAVEKGIAFLAQQLHVTGVR